MKALSVRSGLNTNEKRKQQGLKKDNRYKKYALNNDEDQRYSDLLMRWFKAILRFVYCILYLFSYWKCMTVLEGFSLNKSFNL